jgi:hypothetical protein
LQGRLFGDRLPEQARANTGRWSRRCDHRSPDFRHDRVGLGQVTLGVDLGHVGPGMSQYDLGRFQAITSPDDRGRGMTQLQGRRFGDTSLAASPHNRLAIAPAIVEEAMLLPGDAGRTARSLGWRRLRLPLPCAMAVKFGDNVLRTEQVRLEIGLEELLDDLLGTRPDRDDPILVPPLGLVVTGSVFPVGLAGGSGRSRASRGPPRSGSRSGAGAGPSRRPAWA